MAGSYGSRGVPAPSRNAYPKSGHLIYYTLPKRFNPSQSFNIGLYTAANVDLGMEEDKMAQQEHVYLLKQGVLYWNQWRQQNPDIVLDLSNIDLSRVTLINVDFSRVNLSMANLSGANLSMANLQEANLTMANLSAAAMKMANLRAANMQAVNAREADLRDVDLRAANLKLADLSAADLRGANLEGALFDMTILNHAKGRKGFWNLFFSTMANLG